MSNIYQKLTIKNCWAPKANMSPLLASVRIFGALVVSYGVCMKVT